MWNNAWRLLAPILAAAALAQAARADDSFAPCWRGNPGTTYQSWSFSSSNNPAAPEAINNPDGTSQLTFTAGPFSKGWKAVSFGGKIGIWELGQNGSATVTLPNAASSSAAGKYVQVQVTYFEDSLAYRAPTISMTGAAFVSSKAVTNNTAVPGTWKTLQSIWLIPNGSGPGTIQIQGDITKGLLVDQVVVDTRIPSASQDEAPAFAPCWRGLPGSTFQKWLFGVSNNPASISAELATNSYGSPIASFNLGQFSSEFIDEDPFLGCRQGIWDMGRSGTLALAIPTSTQASSASYQYVQVQVIQYRDRVYNENATVSVSGGTMVNQQQQSLETTPFGGQWVVEQSLWKLATPSPSATQVLVTAPTNSTLLDQVIVETLLVNNSAPSDLALSVDPGQCSKAGVTWSLPSVNNCTVAGIICRTNGAVVSSPATFPVGTTPVVCTVTDMQGGTGAYSFRVTVIDNNPPTISCPGDIVTTKAPGTCGAIVTFAPSVVDNCAGAVVLCTPPSGSTFPLGVTTVSCTAHDASGNASAPCSFQVKVLDYTGDLAAFAPCWRGSPEAVFQHWAFSMPDDPASLPAEKVSNPFGFSNAVIALGPLSSGYIDSDPFLGCRQGIWDLGMLGTLTLTVSNNPAASVTSYTYVQVQVTQYRDGIFNENASVAIPGAVLVTREEQVVESTAFGGHWVVERSLWKLASPSPAAEKVIITAGINSTLIDQVVIDTENFDFACPGNLTLNVDPDQCTRAGVAWAFSPLDDCKVKGMVCRTNGVVVTSPGSFPVGTTPVSCVITDGQGGTFNCGFQVTIIDNELPIAQCKNITVNLDATGKAVVTGAEMNNGSSDNCGTASITVSPDQFTCANLGPNTVTLKVLDLNGNQATCSGVVTVQDVLPPVLVGCPVNATYQCLAQVPSPAPVTALDNCDANVLVNFFEAQSNPGSSCNNTITRTWTAIDAHGNAASCTQTINVHASTAPVLVGVPTDITVECSSIPTPAVVTATDVCNANPTVTMNEVSTQDSDTTHIAHYNYTITRTWTVVDPCQNRASAVQKITVNDSTRPVLAGQGANATIDCSTTPVFTAPSVTDNCDSGPVLTFSDSTNPGACAGTYTITRTWTAVDKAGNISLPVTQAITVRDLTPPVLTGIPPNTTVECSAVPSPATPTATDNCDSHPAVRLAETTTQDPNPAHCGHYNYSITRTWTSTDACQNTASATQVIGVVDTTAPVISTLPGDVTVTCPSQVPAADDAAVVAVDNSNGPLTVIHDPDMISNVVCPNHYTITRTYHATDACGNSSSATQTIVVNDTTRPTIVSAAISSCYPSQSEAEQAALAATTATDNCSASPSKTVLTTIEQCNALITVTVTDDCGNSDSVVYHTHIASELPVIAWVDATQGGNQVKNCSVNVLQGAVNISLQASASCGLLDNHPIVTLANGTDSVSAEFVNESPAGTFNFVWSVTPSTLPGTWTATVSASDVCHSTTSTFTLCVNQAQVAGSVESEAFIGGERVVTFVAAGGVSTKTWNLNLSFVGDTASYVLSDVPPGTTSISAKTAWSLREVLPVNLAENGHAVADFISDGTPGWSDATDHYLRGGDLTGNNLINFGDYSVLGGHFYSFDTVGDITGDGQVDYDDYFILFLNWMTEGDPE